MTAAQPIVLIDVLCHALPCFAVLCFGETDIRTKEEKESKMLTKKGDGTCVWQTSSSPKMETCCCARCRSKTPPR